MLDDTQTHAQAPNHVGRRTLIATTNSGLMSLMLIVLVLAAAMALNERRVAESPSRLAERVQAGQVSTTFEADLNEDLASATSAATATPTSLMIPVGAYQVVRYVVVDGGQVAGHLLVRGIGHVKRDGRIEWSRNSQTVATHLQEPNEVFSAPLPYSTRLRVAPDPRHGLSEHDVPAGLLFTPFG